MEERVQAYILNLGSIPVSQLSWPELSNFVAGELVKAYLCIPLPRVVDSVGLSETWNVQFYQISKLCQ